MWPSVIIPLAPRTYQLLWNNSVLAGDLSSGPLGYLTFHYGHKKYNRGSGRKRTKNKRTIWAWVNSKKGSFVTLHSLCICRLTLACICAKLLQATRNANSSLTVFLTASGLYLTPTALFCCPLSTAPLRLPSPTHLSGFLFQLLSSPTSGLVGDLEPKPFVWFRAKTDKGIVCLADHPHSVTIAVYRPGKAASSSRQLPSFVVAHRKWYREWPGSPPYPDKR